ncbi:MAG: aminotransferase class V-fold PLP-dependent enzyme [Arenicellales bacterium]
MSRPLRESEAGTGFDPGPLRSLFPLLDKAGPSLHYLDNAATTHKPAAVIDAVADCYRRQYGPVHRGLYGLAEDASELYESARTAVGKMIGVPDSGQLIFTRSATESINLVARGWARGRLRAGNEIWVTALEHHSNYLPWQAICRETGARLRVIECRTTASHAAGGLDLEAADGLFGERTRLIAIGHVSNVLGVTNPVRTIVEEAHGRGIAVLVDGAQAVGHTAVDVAALGCDFYAFSAHKMYGPTGIGALYAAPGRAEEMEPLLLGGGMVDEVGASSSEWLPAPAKHEAGSPNLAGAAGFAAAAEFTGGHMLGPAERHVNELAAAAEAALRTIAGITYYGPPPEARRSGIVSFNVENVHPHDVTQIAAAHGVALRAGHHCCQPLMRRLGVPGTVRASFAPYNVRADVDALIESVHDAIDTFA